MEDEIISLHIGNFANYVGTHLRNVQHDLALSDDDLISNESYNTNYDGGSASRCVMVDMFENIGNYPSEVQRSGNQHAEWNGKVSRSEVQQVSFDSWTDVMKTQVHPKSLVQLPKWITSQKFDTFHKGKNSDLVSEELIEDIMDRLRYFAEGCNHVSAVQCYFDLQQGFGGISATVIENVKDHIGNVCLPVFAFSETEAVAQRHDIIGHMKSLNLPLAYHSLMEYASVFIPLECHQSIASMLGSRVATASKFDKLSQAALIASLNIQAATLFDVRASRRSSDLHSVFDWTHAVTHGGRYRWGTLEAYYSDLHSDTFKSSQELEIQIKKVIAASSHTGSRSRSSNPFMASLSSVDYGSYSDFASEFTMPYSNVVTSIGDYPSEFLDTLKSRTSHTPYRISQTSSLRSPLYLPTAQYETVFGPLNAQRQQLEQQYQNLSLISSVGASERVSGYLKNVASAWSEGADISKVQLQKVGLLTDDVNEISEQLLRYSQAYSDSN